ncbi:Lrp/AsnC family transcriptional regulator [Streptomyces sp. NA04227]|nr:Lrp/AsnC family transcriptional regulator [Streptomyces sp. NA04227]
MAKEDRISVLEIARRLGIARGTAQARLDKLFARGVVEGFPPAMSLPAIGYTVIAFAVVQISQGNRPPVIEALDAIAEVCEAHATTGDADLFIRIAARSNSDLQRVIDEIVTVPGVERVSSSIVLSSPIPLRSRQLLERLL